MRFDRDDFALFDLPRRFALDADDLAARRRALQAEVHPDRFAAGGAAAQRVAMQWAVRVNEAYERLKDPLKRAAYLCELGGVPIRAEDNTAMPPEFLMQQMDWREGARRGRDGERRSKRSPPTSTRTGAPPTPSSRARSTTPATSKRQRGRCAR